MVWNNYSVPSPGEIISSIPTTGIYEETFMTTNDTEYLHTTPPPITSRELSIVNFTIGAIGIVDNLFVIIVILASSFLRKQLNMMFILNQSVSDSIVAIMLIGTTFIHGYQIPPGMIMDGELYCRLWLNKLPLWSMLVVSTYNLLALTVERYLAMMHPIWHKINFTRRKAAAMMGLSWMIGLTYNTAFMAPTSVIVNGYCKVYDDWPSQQIRNAFGVLTAVVLFFIPFVTLVFCYGRIALMLRKRVKVAPVTNDEADTENNSQHATGQVQEDRWRKAHRNTIKTLTLVSCCFALCWIWNQVYFMLMNLGLPADYTSNFYHFTVIAIFINCCINPIIYCLKYDQFQREVKRLLFHRFDAVARLTSTTSGITDNTAI